MRSAAIDLGSNSFICLIFEFDSSGELQILDDKIILTRLSEGVDESKCLSMAAMERSKKAFQTFSAMFTKYEVSKIQAVATSAARDAKNKKEFIDLALHFKIPIEILSGDQEAKLTYEGVRRNLEHKNGLIIDIGGGSTEYILIKNGQMVDRVSLDMGVVRFTERFAKGQNFLNGEPILRTAIQKELIQNFKINDFKKNKLEIFLAVSGTPTTAASILIDEFDPLKIEGFEIQRSDFETLFKNYCYRTLDERLELFPFVEEKRADVLPTGLLILDESLKYFDFHKYTISTRGIRHGLAYSMQTDFKRS